MFAALTDHESNRLTGTQATFTLEEVEAHCARIEAADDRYDFAITRPDDPTYLGEVVLLDVDRANRAAVLTASPRAVMSVRPFGEPTAPT